MRIRSTSVVALISIAVATPALAQLCAGTASFANGPARVAVAANFGDHQTSFGAGLGAGMHNSFFGDVAVAHSSTDDSATRTTLSSNVFSASGGYQIPLGPAGIGQICPIASAAYVSGPNNISGTNVDASGDLFAFGATAGMVVSKSPTFEFLPAVGLAFDYQSATLKGDAFGIPVNVSGDIRLGTLTLTPGMVFNRVVSLAPAVAIPFGNKQAKTTYGVAVAVNFPSR